MTGKKYTPEQRVAVRDVIRRAIAEAPNTRRHPAAVTADRLGDHLDRYGAELSGADRDAFARVRHVLEAWVTGTEL